MANFDLALNKTLLFEGGYSNNAADHGGSTNYGITQVTYDGYRRFKGLPLQPVKFITRDEAEDCYRVYYWKPAHCDEMPDNLACVHFDTAVNCGVKSAAKMLQRAVGVTDDGFIGPATLDAVNSGDETDIIRAYLNERDEHYRAIVDNDSSQAVFLHGWLNRVASLQREFC